jgi:hypothetical protein
MPSWVKANPIERHIWNQIHVKNKNFLVCFVGSPGSGKSYAAQKLASDLDRAVDFSPRFGIERVVFKPSEYLNLVEKKLPKGSWIVFDEVGVGINAREWYSQMNKLISYTTQTFRYKNLGVCFTVPALSFLDKQIRLLLHSLVIMKGTSPIQKKSFGVWEWMTYSEYSGKVYHPRPRFFHKGKKYKIQEVSFGLPSDSLVKDYEKKKSETSQNWYEIYSEEMAAIDRTLHKTVKAKKKSPLELYEELSKNKELLKQCFDAQKGKVVAEMLKVLFVDAQKRPVLDRNTAYGVAGLLNKAIREGKLVVQD